MSIRFKRALKKHFLTQEVFFKNLFKNLAKIKVFTPLENKNLRGFTLVEIVISVVILAIAVLGILSAFTTGTRLVHHVRYRLDAVNYVQSVLECFRQQVRADTWDTTGDLRLAPPGPRPCPVVCAGPIPFPAAFNSTCQYTVTDINGFGDITLPRRVDITVTWNRP